MTLTTVVVGSSVGGVRTAQALRSAGYEGEVVLVGEEETLPYDKPPLSKALLSGDATAGSITLLSEGEASDVDIRLRLGCAATRLDTTERFVELADGERLAYDNLVIATGARARSSPWGQPPGVHVLRTLSDATALGRDLRRGGPLVVIGAGFVGAEVASTARTMGIADVAVVDPVAVPLSRVLNPPVAALFTRLHTERGVMTHFGVGVTGIDATDDGLTVHLGDGSELAAATVVVGIGALPNDEWLLSSGLRIEDGVVCDQYCRAIGGPGVYAVGDVARWFHPRHGRLTRVEHWTNAVEQAACVAHNIAHPGQLRAHEPFEYVWSDQYDWKIQLTGRTGAELDHMTVHGTDPDRSFAVLYGDRDGTFAGALTVNWPRALILCRRAVSTAPPVEEVRHSMETTVKHAVRKAG
ncbi:NAD(P)/FAD-dependent oxidoreductase [Streptomyces sp. NPDC050509]|uniref:NAD(P)/FAD-dependent oxidoreductase n=1 Tax=Streptomyces sp. NPDC050509 TaxID=3365620 RepID=UPI0037B55843